MDRKRSHRAAKAGAVVVALGAAALAAFGVSASSRDQTSLQGVLARLAPAIASDPSDAGLKKLAGRMDAAAAALAGRHDPAAAPELWGRTPGWESYDLTRVPSLGLQQVSLEDAQKINAQVPFAGGAGAAKPFVLKASSIAERDRAVRCLATAIYYESALEPERGQRAVAQVVLNRVKHPEFPNTVCGVVFQGWERLTGCQFSFTCDGSLTRAPIPALYRRAEQYAGEALAGYVVPEVGTSTFYHADYVLPYWRPTLSKVNQIGRHIFYRWPGGVGEPRSFVARYRGGELALSEEVIAGRAARPTSIVPEVLPTTGETILVADASSTLMGVDAGRVRGVIAGRRVPTADDIARINETLGRSSSGTTALASAATAHPVGGGFAEDLPMPAPGALPVTEVNKPAK